MNDRSPWSLRWLVGLLLWCCLVWSTPLPALASVHVYPEPPDGVMWRSLQTLRDDADRAWQTVFYKRVKQGQLENLRLRLVGFPGSVELAHPTPLQITAATGETWNASDISTGATSAPSVGEYDLQSAVAQLRSTAPLRLSLPLHGGTTATITVPPFVVREWGQVVHQE